MSIKRTGVYTIVGRPNVGKSTLANRIAGEKIAIVSHKPQTTRSRISAICVREDAQMVFLDTPGYHKPKNALDSYLDRIVETSVADDMDAVVLMVEPIPNVGKQEEALIRMIRSSGSPAILAVNKCDTVKKPELLAVMGAYAEAADFAEIIPISARTGDGVEELLSVLLRHTREGPQLFPDDMVTDQPDRQIVAEIVRETPRGTARFFRRMCAGKRRRRPVVHPRQGPDGEAPVPSLPVAEGRDTLPGADGKRCGLSFG